MVKHTCWHGCALQHNTVMYVPYPIVAGFPYVDPRSDKGNPDVDLAILVVPAKSTEELPYTIPNITWGDSTRLPVPEIPSS